MTAPAPDPTALALLVGIDDHGGLGAAARAQGLAQPNASHTLRRLERDLGLPLVERHARGSRLTPQGTVVVHWARRLLAEIDRLEQAAAALRESRRTTLSIGASMTVAEHLLPGWLGALQRAHPDLRVGLEVANSSAVIDAVAAGTHALGFVETPAPPAELHSRPVAQDRLTVVVAPEHRWARLRRPLATGELAAAPLVTREQGSGTRITFERALGDRPAAAPLLELGSSAAVRTAVIGGVGPAVLSTLAVAEAIAAGRLVEVQVDGLDLRRTLRAVWRSPARLDGPAADLLAEALRSRIPGY